MPHSEYIEYVTGSVASKSDEEEFLKSIEKYRKEADILINLDLDPALPILQPTYSPISRGNPRDPVCMLRSLILMHLLKFTGVTKWVEETKNSSIIAIRGTTARYCLFQAVLLHF